MNEHDYALLGAKIIAENDGQYTMTWFENDLDSGFNYQSKVIAKREGNQIISIWFGALFYADVMETLAKILTKHGKGEELSGFTVSTPTKAMVKPMLLCCEQHGILLQAFTQILLDHRLGKVKLTDEDPSITMARWTTENNKGTIFPTTKCPIITPPCGYGSD